jgi:uncharacterized membrane protein YgdD (TMEM256/DUF423 family)
MRRREFLYGAAASATCVAVGAFGSSSVAEEVRRANYGAFRERLRAIVEEGAVITWCSLAAPRDGSRSALVHVRGRSEPLKFEQPWEGTCI